MSYGGDGYYNVKELFGLTENKGFEKSPDKIWTLIDGKLVEEWYMCTPGIPAPKARCQDLSKLHAVKPKWVDTYNFPSTVAKPPIEPVIEYPSFIYSPANLKSDYHWNYRTDLRKRGVYFGEECLNEDLIKDTNVNITVKH